MARPKSTSSTDSSGTTTTKTVRRIGGTGSGNRSSGYMKTSTKTSTPKAQSTAPSRAPGGRPGSSTSKKRSVTTPAKTTPAKTTPAKTASSSSGRKAQPTAPPGRGQGVVANSMAARARNTTSAMPGRGSSVAVAKKGDTLWSMGARANNVTGNAAKTAQMKKTIKANPQLKDPNKIKPGDYITVK